MGLLFSFNSQSKMSEIQVLNRCYSLIMDQPLDSNHHLAKMVLKDNLTGPKACSKLIEQVSFNKEGLLNNVNEEKLLVLRKFQKLHNSWFPRFNFNQNTQDHPNTDLYDSNEMGYHFTWSTFRNGENIKRALNRNTSFYGLRTSEKPHRYLIDRDISGYRHKRENNSNRNWKYGADGSDGGLYLGPVVFWKPQLVQFGDLVGLKEFKNGKNKINRWMSKKVTTSYFVNKSFGGGAIGTVPYLLLNSGHNDATSDGGKILNRRWSTSVFKDLLCRNLPLQNEAEGRKAVRKNSSIKFRRDYKCQMCHITMDNMAAALRNIEVFNSGDFDEQFSTRNIYHHKAVIGKLNGLPDRNPSFYKSVPEGRVIFRDIYDRTINKPVGSISAIGKVLSESDDFYYCTASKYLSFLTGLSFDIEKIDYKNKKNNDDLENYLIKISEKFKLHKDVKKLFGEIFESKYYSMSDYGVNNAQ